MKERKIEKIRQPVNKYGTLQCDNLQNIFKIRKSNLPARSNVTNLCLTIFFKLQEPTSIGAIFMAQFLRLRIKFESLAHYKEYSFDFLHSREKIMLNLYRAVTLDFSKPI